MQRSKEKIVENILKQNMYNTDSGIYKNVYARLIKMPKKILTDLELIITFKVMESNELTRQVDKILQK